MKLIKFLDVVGKYYPVINFMPLMMEEYDDVQIVYYWYHHMMPDDERRDIETSIEYHDFSTFRYFYEDLSKYEKDVVYLPDHATVFWYGHVLGEIDVANNKELFNLITDHESECG